MTALAAQAIDAIITNTIAVVEGTGSYTGVPGVFSHDEFLRGSHPSANPFDAHADQTASTTALKVGGITTEVFASDKWSPTRAPPFFVCCSAATNAVNINASRKITAWDQTTVTATVVAFPANITAGDTFNILEGFRGAVDGDESDVSADRRFTVSLDPGDVADIYGAGNRTIKSELVLRLTLEKKGRATSWRRAAVDNAEILRSAVALRTHWEATYTRAVATDGSKIELDEEAGVVEIRWPIWYRYSTAFV